MLGIDIGNYSIKVAVVKDIGRVGARIEQLAYEVLPEKNRGGVADTSTLQRIVTNLIKKVGRGHDRVALSVPVSSVILKTIKVNAGLHDSLLHGEVQMGMVDFIPFPLEQVCLDYVNLGKIANEPEKEGIFVVVSQRNVVDKVANAINVKSIKKKEVDVDIFALGQVLEKIKGKDYEESYAIIDIGYQTTLVGIFKNGKVIFNREQQIGGYHLTEAIAEESGMTLSTAEDVKINNIKSVSNAVISAYLDSLNEQISLALEFFSSTTDDNYPATIYLTGGGSAVPGILDALSKNLPKYIFEFLPIGEEIKVSRKINKIKLDEIRAYSAVVSGLAMRK